MSLLVTSAAALRATMVMSAFSFTQPENSERSRGEHHFRGLTNPDTNQKEYTKGFFCYMTLSLFS